MHIADKQYILKKCPYLLNEMISTAHQLFFYDQAGRGTIRYDVVYLTYSKKVTCSQLSPPHGTNRKIKGKN